MLRVVSRVKNIFSDHPRISRFLGRVYHLINYYNVSQSQLHMLKRQLRLQRYFEAVFSGELDYLRQRCRELEDLYQNQGNSLPGGAFFPRIDSLDCTRPTTATAHVDVPVYTKFYKTKDRWAGLSGEQAFLLEIFCLNRLKSKIGTSNSKHYPFPKVVGIHEDQLCVELSHCGRSLDQITESENQLVIPNHQQQLQTIVSYLVESGVMHLDLRPDGKNLCVDEHGNLSLIDFDIACCINARPMSFQISRRLDIALRYPGGYEAWAISRLKRSLDRHKNKLKLL